MSSFRIRYDWVDFGNDADHRSLQVTFAQLTIAVGDLKVTRILDKRAQTTREFISVPLYPIAEWMVANWWSLLEEVEVPSRGTSSEEYRSRHSLRESREGYVIPDVEFFPEGDWTRIIWKQSSGLFQAVEFLEGGSDRVKTDELRQTFADLIDAVVGRLELHGVADTWLQEEWTAIGQVSADERDYCVTAGWLGLDPFDLSDVTAGEIVRVSGELPGYLCGEVLRATPATKLADAASWVRSGLDAINLNSTVDGAWNTLRQKIPQAAVDGVPWEIGYQLAQSLRDTLNLAGVVAVDIDTLVGVPFPIIEAEKPPVASFDGLVGVGRDSLCCFTAKQHPISKRFMCARGLLGFLFEKSHKPEFYSSAQTDRQQRSRAFAAEFLAPASLITPRLSSDDISMDEVEELALEFQVSPYVIGYQIRNHKLGKVIE